MNSDVYTITLPKFFKHNPKSKKSFTHFMISTSFFNDDKIARCTPGMVALYVYLMSVCADYASGTIKVSARSVPTPLKVGVRFAEVLNRLEELQLLTIEKIDSLNNRIEEKRIEEKRREEVGGSKMNGVKLAKVEIAAPSEPPPKTNRVIARYCELWKERYGGEPPISGRVAGQFKTFVKDHGEAKALSFVEGFLEMPDKWFVTKRHDVGTMLANLNAIAQYLATGKVYSQKEINTLDANVGTKNLLDMIDRGEV